MSAAYPEAIGWYDDGSESGALRTRPVRGDLVRVPFRGNDFATETSGSATITPQSANVPSNPDASGRGMSISVPSGLNNGVRLWRVAYGAAIGVRWKRSSTSGNFSLLVDGVPYAVAGAEDFVSAEGLTLQDDEASFVVENLPDGRHVVEVIVYAPASGTSSVLLYGWLLERRWGYESLRAQVIQSTITLTTSQTAIPFGAGSTSSLRGIRKVFYTNTSGAAAVVTVQFGGLTMWAKNIAAGDTVEMDFGAVTAIGTSSPTHAAASASSINATIIGEVF